jgi:mersacidin/lichenicidin family type 2 lantibiotic
MPKEIKVEQEARLNDEAYRNTLTPEQLAKRPPEPADGSELREEEMDGVTGGSYFGDMARFIAKAFKRNSDERRPTK